jgi:hypothetical protein
MTILKFRESLVRSLLLGMPFEKLKPIQRQKAIGQTKRKLADTSSKKKKDLLAMSEDTVLAATRKSVNNNQEKSVMQLQKK